MVLTMEMILSSIWISAVVDVCRARSLQAGQSKVSPTIVAMSCERSRVSMTATLNQIIGILWWFSDTIWRAIGDSSTDSNYYSKRVILSSVIGTTLPVWLSDQSDDKAAARAFLDNRIENVMEFEKFKWRVKSFTKDMPEPAEILGQLRYGGTDLFMRPKKGRARRRRYSR